MSCRKASYIIEKRAVSKITVVEKIQLKFHLAICKLCQKYEKDSAILGKILHRLHLNDNPNIKLSEDDKKELKEKLKPIL